MSLKVEKLSFSYGRRRILEEISFETPEGSVLGLLGPNGTGKTTLLKAVGALHHPESGACYLDGRDLKRMSAQERARLAAYVPQSSNGVFAARVMDTVLMGRLPFIRFAPGAEDKEIAAGVIRRLELTDKAFHYLNELSGGERQRVLIARALAQEPRLLLLDEPTSSLDMKNQLHTLGLVQSLAREKRLTVVIAIHDLNLAAMFCDRFVMLKDARLFAWGTEDEVITEENIAAVYGVRTEIHRLGGRRHVVLLRNEENGGR